MKRLQQDSDRPKRYGWFRLYNGFWSHPKWRAVAKRSGIHVTTVIAVAAVILESANRGKPRGSVADFSVADCAAGLDLDMDTVREIWHRLEEMGWIDRDYLVKWDERQPDKEDATAAERMKRYRARKKDAVAQKQLDLGGVTGITGDKRYGVTQESYGVTESDASDKQAQSDALRRCTVTLRNVTPKTQKERKSLTCAEPVTCGDNFSDQHAPRSLASAPPPGALARSALTQQEEPKRSSNGTLVVSAELQTVMQYKRWAK